MIWVDAQLPPAIARWLRDTFGLDASALREIGLRDAEDEEIFEAAKKDDAIVITKDADFVILLERLGPPPKIILLTCGNTSNVHL
jgi:predicted nuclease of predicted toxin-antitoxin system